MRRRAFLTALATGLVSTLPFASAARAQSGLRNFSHETVAGRALVLEDGVAEFQRNGSYRWTPKTGRVSEGQWGLIQDVGPHPRVIQVRFTSGNVVNFRIQETGGVFYLIRPNGARYRVLQFRSI